MALAKYHVKCEANYVSNNLKDKPNDRKRNESDIVAEEL